MPDLILAPNQPQSNQVSAFPRPSLWKIFRTWLLIGVQSFGGGTSTFILIHQVCIDQAWLTEEEFVRAWGLVQISPGINLVKLTMLIAHRLRGWPGLVAGTAGLLVPSAGVTVLMTAGFVAIRGQPLVQAALRGVLPATIGLSLAMAIQMGQPIFKRAYREGFSRLAVQLLIVAVSALLLAFAGLSPVLVLLLAGAFTMLAMALIHPSPPASRQEPDR